jgi:hypothetical protein
MMQYKGLFINGRPRYLRCVLDQSYYPDGIYTAPSRDAIERDLRLAQSLGFNCLRIHVKGDEPLKYRLADEMGMLILYDMPSLDLLSANDEAFVGRRHFENQLERLVERDGNHPSIVAWVVFNENWGLMEQGSLLEPQSLEESAGLQRWLAAMVARVRELDPTRPVEDNSAGGIVGAFEHLQTDLNSFHYYGTDIDAFREFLDQQAAVTYPGSPANMVGGGVQDGAPWFNSEFASFSVSSDSTGTDAFCNLFPMLNELRRQPKLMGYVLTQLTDLEWELNGLVEYDRSPKTDLCERHGIGLPQAVADDAVIFDWRRGHVVGVASTVPVPLWISHWSSMTPQDLRVTLRFGDGSTEAEAWVRTRPTELVSVDVPVTVPSDTGPIELVAELWDGSAERLGGNRLSLDVE